MSIRTHKLSDEEKIKLLIQLIKARMISLKVNCLHEVEIIPTGFNWENYWYIIGNWGIDEHDVNLMSKLLVSLHKNGIILAKHIEH